ncbi:MAG: hypothetical protein ABGX27_00385 [Desulfurobacteriaceae bacterium]
MKVLQSFEDEYYLLIEVIWKGEIFIFFLDKTQGTETLGIPQKGFKLSEVLEKHKKDKNYCLPCELLLKLEKKVARHENNVLEWGLTLEKLERFRQKLLSGGSDVKGY